VDRVLSNGSKKQGITDLTAIHRGSPFTSTQNNRNVPNWELPIACAERYRTFR